VEWCTQLTGMRHASSKIQSVQVWRQLIEFRRHGSHTFHTLSQAQPSICGKVFEQNHPSKMQNCLCLWVPKLSCALPPQHEPLTQEAWAHSDGRLLPGNVPVLEQVKGLAPDNDHYLLETPQHALHPTHACGRAVAAMAANTRTAVS